MKDIVKAAILPVIISFTVPTLVVASNWGSYQANQEAIMIKLEKIDRKVDKMNDKLYDTREDVSLLKGKTFNTSQ